MKYEAHSGIYMEWQFLRALSPCIFLGLNAAIIEHVHWALNVIEIFII